MSKFLKILGLQPQKFFSITRTIFSHSRSVSNKIPFVAIIVFICHWKVFVESRNSVEKSWISKMGINHEHDSWFADYYSVNKGVNSPTPFLVLVQKCTDLGYASTLHWRVTVEPRRVVIIWSWTLTRGWTKKKNIISSVLWRFDNRQKEYWMWSTTDNFG